MMEHYFIIPFISVILTFSFLMKLKYWNNLISQKGIYYFFKWSFNHAYLKLCCRREKRIGKYHWKCMLPQSVGFWPSKNEINMENSYCLLSDGNLQVFDSLYFSGWDTNGNCIMCHIIRRLNRHYEVWLYLKNKELGEFVACCYPNTNVYNTNGESFSAIGLNFEVLEPMRRWRISFNGMMRNKQFNTLVHVKFSFIWSAFSLPFDYNYELSENLMAHCFAATNWRSILLMTKDPIKKMIGQDRYEQWGQLYGTLAIDNCEELILHFHGLRSHSFGVLDWKNLETNIDLEVSFMDGTFIHIGNIKLLYEHFILSYGWILKPTGEKLSINWMESLETKDFESFSNRKVKFQAGTEIYEMIVHSSNSVISLLVGECHQRQITIKASTFEMNESKGSGFVKVIMKNENEKCALEMTSFPYLKPSNKTYAYLITNLDSEACCSINLVGGKAVSLALLKQINLQFLVPKALCITSHAYFNTINKFTELSDSIQELESVIWKKKEGDSKVFCNRVIGLFKNIQLDNNLQREIENEIIRLFGKDHNILQFAIRSSAIGEDGEETSAAGQNETYLGISGIENIYNCIIKCWSSQFSIQAVEYKRQNGYPLNPGMGVIVQEIVPADSSGIMFTNDPVTGNPSKIIITANYGLGESVVSGSANPDTFVLEKTFDDVVNVKEMQLGSKKTHIVLLNKDDNENGTTEVNTDDGNSHKFCLSKEKVIELGNTGVMIEKMFGSARDIEWAFVKDQLFLLQSRPITTGELISSFELMHEFDSPMKTNHEHSTKANTGEVFPGASSPLTISTVVRALDISLQINMKNRLQAYYIYNPLCFTCEVTAFNHVMLNCIDIVCRSSSVQQKAVKEVIELSLFGHLLGNTQMYDLAADRYRGFVSSKMRFLYCFIKELILNKHTLKTMIAEYKNFHFIDESSNSPEEVYNSISSYITLLIKCGYYHSIISSASLFWNLIAVQTLVGNTSVNWTEEIYGDIASLLSSCADVESAEVPSLMKNLALEIIREEEWNKFANELSLEDAVKWLVNHPGKIGKLYHNFLEKHGHRCLKEFELQSNSWKQKQSAFVEVIQNMVKNPDHLRTKKECLSIDETLKQLKSPLSYVKKKILALILPQYRAAVGYREQSKSVFIRAVDNLRIAYTLLATLMVNEGQLPDSQLIYYLTHYEIGQLIHSRSPKLIRKAFSRRRIHPLLDKLCFPELIVGIPKPQEKRDLLSTSVLSDVKIIGTPVCHGTVKGIARVVTSLSEANKIQANDILITYCTDIGWSPYFPLLSGVVTEIGGILSHGAVVAREYGLPCIVGAHNATSVFQSGNVVLLNGSKGILELIQQ